MSREAFEAAMLSLHPDWDEWWFTRYQNGEYHVDAVREAFVGWLLRDAENAALKARILAYDAWFDAHAAILANHRIGGNKFVGHGGVIEPTGNLEVRDE